MRTTTLSLHAAALALAAGPPAAEAHVLNRVYINQNNFHYRVLHVPDLDQRRYNLPNDGSWYCVPTSHMNFAAYVAEHGFPGQPPGVHNWHTTGNFSVMSGELIDLGGLMGTGATTGTSPVGGTLGSSIWFAPRAIVTAFEMDSDYTPRLKSLAARAADGALIVPRIGWYNEAAYPVIVRTGGHCVSMTYARAYNANEKSIGINDPGSDNGILSAQSTYTTDYYDVGNRDVFVAPSFQNKTMSRIHGYGGATTNGYIYGFYQISPVVTLVGADAEMVKAKFTFDDEGIESSLIVSDNLADIIDAALGADLFNSYFLTAPILEQLGGLWQYDSVSDDATQIATVEDPIDVCTGRRLQVYVVDGRTLRCFTPEWDEPVERQAPIPIPVEQVVYDDLTDQVVCVSMTQRRFLRFGAGLGGTPEILAWPADLIVGDRYSVAIDGATGALWFADTDNDKLFMVAEDASGRLFAEPYGAPELEGPRALAVNDLGELIVACDGSVRVFRQGEAGQLVDITDGTSYGAIPTGDFIAVGTSRSNLNPASYGGPDSYDVLPTNFSGATKIPSGRFLPAFRP